MPSVPLSPDELKVVHYPHLALRFVAKPLKRVDSTLKQVAARMIELMYEHHGVGLAATQVGLPMRMFVWNPTGDAQKQPARVYLNPIITRPRSHDEAEEGCLSLPGVHANVVRAKSIHLHAFEIDGTEVDREFDGFEARIVQHENDHLDGLMFIDRLSPEGLRELAPTLETFATDFTSRQRLGSIEQDVALQQRLIAWESSYC